MATASRLKYPHITRDPAIQAGEPVIAGTRLPVRAVVLAWRELRDTQAVLAGYPRLNEDTLAEALAYYEHHREEIDSLIQAQTDGT